MPVAHDSSHTNFPYCCPICNGSIPLSHATSPSNVICLCLMPLSHVTFPCHFPMLLFHVTVPCHFPMPTSHTAVPYHYHMPLSHCPTPVSRAIVRCLCPIALTYMYHSSMYNNCHASLECHSVVPHDCARGCTILHHWPMYVMAGC
jgi:hypothetical protein